jgi:hypothetical protein
MNTTDNKLIETPNQAVTTEAKKEIEKLAQELKNPKIAESFNSLLARKSAQVF